MARYILALDQGTTSSRAIVFDEKATIVASAQEEFPQIYPKPGWVEHDPEDIWRTQLGVMRAAVDQAGLKMEDIRAIGITNQRETSILWDASTGKPIYNAVVWQCRRTADVCAELAREHESEIYAKTGLPVDAYFSGTKIAWILDRVDGARERAERGEIKFGTVDTFLMYRLSGGKIHATDYTNASRTMLYNIHDMEWDAELTNLLRVPRAVLPKVLPSGTLYGYTDEGVVGARIPICGVAGDQQSALFGQLCVDEGCIKNTYGTGCFTLMNTGAKPIKSKRGLVTTLAAVREGETPQYVLEGSVFVGGAVLQWLRDELKIISSAREADEISERVTDGGGVYFVPAFVGLGAPHWDSRARGLITGITRGTSREQIVRAALEAIAFQVFDVVNAMSNDVEAPITALKVDGGAAVSDVLMQFQSDLLGADIIRPTLVESTALGAAYLAGLSVGLWRDMQEIAALSPRCTTFSPKMTADERKERLMGWEVAVARAKYR